MRKNRWVANAMLSVSLASLCSVCLAKVDKRDALLTQQTGVASYYSDKFHRMKTTSGEPYNKEQMTAAHASLPLGTKLRVTNLANHHSVEVRINDRPNHSNKRLLDLSKQAARELGFLGAGTAKVKIEVINIG